MRFKHLARITVGAVLFLVLVGALVRMTGSGMGCPDWPTCFGKIIPPTDISELPTDYKTRFAVQGKEIADFDPVKTWIEYVNRLIGVLVGFLALFTTIASFFLIKEYGKAPLWWSLAGLFFVILAAGVGAVVVMTDLHTGTITIHMVIALLTVFSFIMATFTVADDSRVKHVKIPNHIWGMAGILVAFTLAQIIMGTQVREQIDLIAKSLGEASRESWIGELVGVYHLHKVFHYGLFLVLIGLMVQLRFIKTKLGPVKNLLVLCFILMATEALIGISMHNLGIPAWLQPLHLLFAAFIFASEIGVIGWMLKAHKKVPDPSH